jgi:hypothetical protein
MEREVEQKGGETQTLTVALVRGGTVFGEVTNGTDWDLAAATVSLDCGAPVWAPGCALGKGSYRLDPVAPGTYHPVVRLRGGPALAVRGYTPVTVAPAPAEHRLDFTVVKGGTLVARVDFASRPSPQALAALKLVVAGDGVERSYPTALRVDLAPGRYEVRLHEGERLLAHETADIAEGKVTEIALALP